MPELLGQLSNDDPEYMFVRNNAIWALGEIAIRWSKIQRCVPTILPILVPLIYHADHLLENTINTIGRIGLSAPESLARYLPNIGQDWLYRSRKMRENDEKDTAFQGLCRAVQLYPEGLNEMVG
ncbi:hypothetical protein G6F68_018901 [Rhizopus microsporus]|nr:hypothetical protein G6F68_018901 [Rhizopus microsporus]